MDKTIMESDPDAPPPVINPVPPLKPEAYWHYLEDMDLSDDEKAAVLQTLWSMMVTFVDLGFNADPVQHILPALVHGTLAADGSTLEQGQARRFNCAVQHGRQQEDKNE